MMDTPGRSNMTSISVSIITEETGSLRRLFTGFSSTLLKQTRPVLGIRIRSPPFAYRPFAPEKPKTLHRLHTTSLGNPLTCTMECSERLLRHRFPKFSVTLLRRPVPLDDLWHCRTDLAKSCVEFTSFFCSTHSLPPRPSKVPHYPTAPTSFSDQNTMDDCCGLCCICISCFGESAR
jgi:hypothetical protein